LVEALEAKAHPPNRNRYSENLGKGSVVPREGYLGIRRVICATILNCYRVDLSRQCAKIGLHENVNCYKEVS
jgi:hypothetical protein